MDSSEHLHLTPPHQLHTEVDDTLVVHQVTAAIRPTADIELAGMEMASTMHGIRLLPRRSNTVSPAAGFGSLPSWPTVMLRLFSTTTVLFGLED